MIHPGFAALIIDQLTKRLIQQNIADRIYYHSPWVQAEKRYRCPRGDSELALLRHPPTPDVPHLVAV